jgi:hypothetical protein
MDADRTLHIGCLVRVTDPAYFNTKWHGRIGRLVEVSEGYDHSREEEDLYDHIVEFLPNEYTPGDSVGWGGSDHVDTFCARELTALAGNEEDYAEWMIATLSA